MFGNKNTKKATPVNNSVSTLAKGTFIEGNLKCEGTLVIEGNFFGTIEGCEKLVVGENGTVDGNMDVKNALVFGQIDGIVRVKELLHIQSTGKIKGDISTLKICIDIGGEFSGNCQMGPQTSTAKRNSDTQPVKNKKVAQTGSLFVESKAS